MLVEIVVLQNSFITDEFLNIWSSLVK